MNPFGDHRNDELDAAWRAASREEPPAALDATIAAAARRAVGAGPGSAHRSRAWWPVAAAAVVAVVAIGIVEMTPPEQVAPTAIAPALKPAPVAEPAARRDAGRGDEGRAERAAAASSTTAQAKVSGTDGERAKPANPFPEQPSESGATTATPAPATAPVDRLAAPRRAMRQEGGANAPQTPAPITDEAKERPSSGAARALAGRSKPAAANATAALDKQASDRDAKPNELPTRPVDEWIRLIRRLKAEGRNDLAAKELVAFRARYQERADDLLPADLREAKP